jgi:hypothetical protein
MSLLTLILVGGLAFLLLTALLAPLESLGWYAGWFGDGDEREQDLHFAPQPVPPDPGARARHYLVYLSGIGAISPDSIPQEEHPFITGMAERLAGTQVIADVFPYSVTNLGLTEHRVAMRFWRWIEKLRLKNPQTMIAFLVNVRNFFQVAVSADHRYGPVYNLGVAQEIRDALVRHGYPLDRKTPVTLLGVSGGGQTAIGAAWYLRNLVRAPVRVISLGGVLSADRGLDRVEHLWHLYGEKDAIQALGRFLFPGRWRLAVASPWNRALQEGRISFISLGPLTHNNAGHYFDATATLPQGISPLDHTLATIHSLLAGANLSD